MALSKNPTKPWRETLSTESSVQAGNVDGVKLRLSC